MLIAFYVNDALIEGVCCKNYAALMYVIGGAVA